MLLAIFKVSSIWFIAEAYSVFLYSSSFSSFSKVDLLNAEYYSEELDIETTTKTDENKSSKIIKPHINH